MATPLQQVSDTGIWVAHYRARESKRNDALFHDDMASKLVGEFADIIDTQLKEFSKFVNYHVVIRTVIIDRFIQTLLSEGIDTVLNLGAGLDTRPYRMKLPKNVRWIEIDFPHVIESKTKKLENETPTVALDRIGLDLSSREERRKALSRIAATSKNILVITEGVINYLTEEQVGQLADDIHAEQSFRYWIAEYNSPLAIQFVRSSGHRRGMKNTPFRFMPRDWFQFFEKHKWVQKEIVYIQDEAERLNRPVPMPWYGKLILPFATRSFKEKVRQMSAYVVYRPIR